MKLLPYNNYITALRGEIQGKGDGVTMLQEQKHQCLVFESGDALFAVELAHVQHVIPFTTQLQRIKPPRKAAYMNCLLKVDGELVPVLECPEEETALDAGACFVLLDDGNKRLGVIAKKVCDIISFSSDEVTEDAKAASHAFVYNDRVYCGVDVREVYDQVEMWGQGSA